MQNELANGQDMVMAEIPTPQPQIKKVSETQEWRPSDTEVLRDHEIRIRFLNRGCVVSVGCKEIAFEDYTNAMGAINAYVANPYEEQQKWRKILN